MNKAEYEVWDAERAIPNTRILRRGWPDFLVERNGGIFGIEVKTPNDKLSADQELMHATLRRYGINTRIIIVDNTAARLTPAQENQVDAYYDLPRLISRREQLKRQLVEIQEYIDTAFYKIPTQ